MSSCTKRNHRIWAFYAILLEARRWRFGSSQHTTEAPQLGLSGSWAALSSVLVVVVEQGLEVGVSRLSWGRFLWTPGGRILGVFGALTECAEALRWADPGRRGHAMARELEVSVCGNDVLVQHVFWILGVREAGFLTYLWGLRDSTWGSCWKARIQSSVDWYGFC